MKEEAAEIKSTYDMEEKLDLCKTKSDHREVRNIDTDDNPKKHKISVIDHQDGCVMLKEQFTINEEENSKVIGLEMLNDLGIENDKKRNEDIVSEETIDPIGESKTDTMPNLISYSDLKSNVIKRDFLANNIYKPFFNKVKGGLVRFNSPNEYKVCKIFDIKHGSEYFYFYDGNRYRTDKYLVLIYDTKHFSVPLHFISNSRIKIEEYERFCDLDIQMRNFCQFEKIESLMNRPMSKQEQIMHDDEKRSFMFTINKRISFYKRDLIIKRKEAIENHNLNLTKQIEEVLYKFHENGATMPDIQVNEYARKFSLRVSGGDVTKNIVKAKKHKISKN